MHALSVLQRWFENQLPTMHALRRRALFDVVDAAARGNLLSISRLGHRCQGSQFLKHRIKRVDRLIGNIHLNTERFTLYRCMARTVLRGVDGPLILIDWSDLTPDQQWHLLRAVVPAKGRALVLYEGLKGTGLKGTEAF